MNDLRGRTKALELQVADASGYLFVSGWNVVAAAFWLAIFANCCLPSEEAIEKLLRQ